MSTHVARASRLLILYRLREARLIEGMTYQEIGDLLGCDRSTAYRLMQSLQDAETHVPEIMEQARKKQESKAPLK